TPGLEKCLFWNHNSIIGFFSSQFFFLEYAADADVSRLWGARAFRRHFKFPKKTRGMQMRFLTKVTLGLAALLISITIAPATKADSITISSGGFSLSDLGNNGGGVPGMDSLLGTAASAGQTINGSGSFVALLNPLTFTTAFTGHGSEGTYNFNFAQDVTIDGVTQTLNIAGTIDIGTFVDTVHILSSDPLTFN